LSGSLITGNTTLFGFKTEMQFGKLNVTTVLSQQESESKTINLSGGAQTTDFDIAADQYDENRHFFLAHYFRDNYDSFMSKLPHITSGIVINKIEVWITNKNAVDFNQARNIVGFMDLAEPTRINNTHWIPSATTLVPDNDANSLYREVIGIDGYRTISLVNNALGQSLSGFGIVGGEDYVKIESARRLEPTEYSLNKQLGFISLRRTLGTDEVLAVAYEYTYNGKVYQVGEFSTDGIESPNVLTLKLLKGVSQSPNVPMWDLMMKNVYSLGAFQVQKDKFRLDVMYRSDSTGVDLNYIPKGKIANTILLRVMNLDRLDSRSQQNPDGVFDFVENFTVIPENGRIIFPVVEPFGSHLRKAFDDDVVANEFVFQELYDSTIVVAKEVAEKNKFRLVGQYRSSSGSEIRLNAMNVPQGSVKVTAGGRHAGHAGVERGELGAVGLFDHGQARLEGVDLIAHGFDAAVQAVGAAGDPPVARKQVGGGRLHRAAEGADHCGGGRKVGQFHLAESRCDGQFRCRQGTTFAIQPFWSSRHHFLQCRGPGS